MSEAAPGTSLVLRRRILGLEVLSSDKVDISRAQQLTLWLRCQVSCGGNPWSSHFIPMKTTFLADGISIRACDLPLHVEENHRIERDAIHTWPL